MGVSRWLGGAAFLLLVTFSGCGGPTPPPRATSSADKPEKAETVEEPHVAPSFGLQKPAGEGPATPAPKSTAAPNFGVVGNAPPVKKKPAAAAPSFGLAKGTKPSGQPVAQPSFPKFGQAGGTTGIPGQVKAKSIEDRLRDIFGTAPPPVTFASNETSPPPKAPTEPATAQQVSDLLLHARSDADPATAIRRLQQFQTQYVLKDSQQARISTQLTELKQKVADGMIRNGNDWITREEAKQQQQQAQEQIKRAIKDLATVLKKGNRGNRAKFRKQLEPALTLLERASRMDPNNLQADFGLGALHTALVLNQPPIASKHFRRARSRRPDHVPTLNNLALSELQNKGYAEAIKLWRIALAIEPDNTAVIHNLFRSVSEGRRSSLFMGERFIEIYTKQCRRLKADDQFDAALTAASKKGWIYLSLHDPKKKRPSVFYVDDSCNGCQRQGILRGGNRCKHCQGRGTDPRL